jgi:quercetin dioxygenase-like cupin family protein
MGSRCFLTMALAIAAGSSACAEAKTAALAAACPTLGADFARSGKVLKLYRAYTGADGKSKIETIDLPGTDGVYYGGKVSLTQFGLGDPANAVIVYGHPGMDIPPHRSPYREVFLILSGSSTIELADGTVYDMKPGSMLLGEDQDSRSGRGGKSGPCGYVAVDFQFKGAAKAEPAKGAGQ